MNKNAGKIFLKINIMKQIVQFVGLVDKETDEDLLKLYPFFVEYIKQKNSKSLTSKFMKRSCWKCDDFECLP